MVWDISRRWLRSPRHQHPPGLTEPFPLCRVRPSDGDAAHLASVLQRLVASVAGSAESCTAATNVLSPTVATAASAATATNLLSEIDSAAQRVIGVRSTHTCMFLRCC